MTVFRSCNLIRVAHSGAAYFRIVENIDRESIHLSVVEERNIILARCERKACLSTEFILAFPDVFGLPVRICQRDNIDVQHILLIEKIWYFNARAGNLYRCNVYIGLPVNAFYDKVARIIDNRIPDEFRSCDFLGMSVSKCCGHRNICSLRCIPGVDLSLILCGRFGKLDRDNAAHCVSVLSMYRNIGLCLYRSQLVCRTGNSNLCAILINQLGTNIFRIRNAHVIYYAVIKSPDFTDGHCVHCHGVRELSFAYRVLRDGITGHNKLIFSAFILTLYRTVGFSG